MNVQKSCFRGVVFTSREGSDGMIITRPGECGHSVSHRPTSSAVGEKSAHLLLSP